MPFRIAAAAGTSVPAGPLPVAERPSPPSMIVTMAPFVIIIVIFWFLVIRPQQKQQKETEKMLAALKAGDRVVTSGGVHGTVVSFKDPEKAVVIEVAPGVRITVNRSAVATVRREALPPSSAAR